MQTGSRIGHYDIVSALGRGGMGEVWRAQDTKLRREVAIKALPAEFAQDKDRLARLEREATSLAALNHPNIAAIYGLEEHLGTRFLVLELVEGTTLAERLLRGPISIDETLQISAQIAAALEAAHDKGVMHRDLKPANVIITPEGRVKVLDFGLAKNLARTPTGVPAPTELRTEIGVIMGTAPYMSPEQARGEGVGRQTDIWSLGVMLYEMLTGQLPFEGDTTTDTFVSVLEKQPAYSVLPKNTPAGARLVLRRCLEKDWKRRFQHAGDVRIEIEDTLAGPAAEPARGANGPLRLAAAALVVAGLVGLAAWILGVGAWLWSPGSGQLAGTPSTAESLLANARFTRLTDFEGDEMDPAISPDGGFVAFIADRAGRFDVWMGQVGTGRFVNLTQDEPKDFSARIRVRSVGFSADGADIWLGGGAEGTRKMLMLPLTGGTPKPFLGDRVVNVAWSRDGARMVYHTRDPGDPMFIADRDGGNARRILVDRPDVHNHYPVWSQDAQWIYFVRGVWSADAMDLWRIPASGGQPEQMTHQSTDVRFPVPIDARTVLYVAPASDGSGPWLWALDVERKSTRRVSFGLEKYTAISATPDGARVVASVANPTANLWSVPIGSGIAEERDVTRFPLQSVRAWAPRLANQSLFYLSSLGAGDGLWRLQDGQVHEIWKGSDGALLEAPAVSANGRSVAFGLRRQGRLQLYRLSADGGELQRLADDIDVQGSADWSRDGKWIVTGGIDAMGPALFKIPVDGGAPVRLVTGPAFNPVCSPDGNLIVYTGPNVGTDAPMLAVRPDGTSMDLPAIRVASPGERVRFLPDGNVVYMSGPFGRDFWLLDLATKQTRQLTKLDDSASLRTFDVTPDGKRIVFDRKRDNSDIVLIDLKKESSL